jgi:hypothetical protein
MLPAPTMLNLEELGMSQVSLGAGLSLRSQTGCASSPMASGQHRADGLNE